MALILFWYRVGVLLVLFCFLVCLGYCLDIVCVCVCVCTFFVWVGIDWVWSWYVFCVVLDKTWCGVVLLGIVLVLFGIICL